MCFLYFLHLFICCRYHYLKLQSYILSAHFLLISLWPTPSNFHINKTNYLLYYFSCIWSTALLPLYMDSGNLSAVEWFWQDSPSFPVSPSGGSVLGHPLRPGAGAGVPSPGGQRAHLAGRSPRCRSPWQSKACNGVLFWFIFSFSFVLSMNELTIVPIYY